LRVIIFYLNLKFSGYIFDFVPEAIMKMNDKGIALICEFEGCRTEAYQDAVGVWTIGYGHTSVAGSPSVGPGATVTRDEAAGILMRDLETFCAGVKSAITATLDDNQFSALVSFAYNVGLGNFRNSSVLRSVNAYRYDQVPAELAQWVTAGGKVLPGLIRRRAAEAALFLLDDQPASFSTTNYQTVSSIATGVSNSGGIGQGIEPLAGGLTGSSHINLAALLSGAGGFVSSVSHHLEDWIGERASLTLEIAAMIVVIAAVFWIINAHRRTMAQHHVDSRTPSGAPAML
jgi:GH24 family phage-related lysozyme (muramidase)